MGFLFLVLIALISFASLFFAYKFFKVSGLYVFAIGGAVASNIFSIESYGINVGSFVFGIDSVIYTLFIFCVCLILVDYGKSEAMVLTYSSIASIMFTAVIQFIAIWATSGFASNIILGFTSFAISALATYVAIILSVYVFSKLKNKANAYFNICIFIIIASIINSLIYFGLISLITGKVAGNFVGTLLGSYIGKLMCAVISIIVYCCLNAFKPKLKKT